MELQWNHKIFSVAPDDFDPLALDIFNFQYENNQVYKAYANALKINPRSVRKITEIPFLPIEFFKTHLIKTTSFEPVKVFESSGTTGMEKSRHFIKDISYYEESFIKGFELFYGPTNNYCFLFLLPSYIERENSSLVFMAEKLIGLSKHPQSGFYLCDYEKLAGVLFELEKKKQKTILFGVLFALLDFAERFPMKLENTIVMETGGMKGRREELVRREAHEILKNHFAISNVHSEYGMTELLSQAWSKGDGFFYAPPWLKVMIRNEDDPLEINQRGVGAINGIDLANIYSCSFIATDDAGKLYDDGSFEVTGRLDNSELRGCSLMVV